MTHDSDVVAFAEDLREEVLATAGIDEEESYREDVFTELVIQALAESGEVDDAATCYHRSHGLQLNGFGISSGGDTLYIFVAVCKWEVPPPTLRKAETESVLRRALAFFQRSCAGLHEQLEEASDAFDAALQIYQAKETIAGVRVILISDCVAERLPALESPVDGITCSFEVWDIVRLHRLWTSGHEREQVRVDFVALFGTPLEVMAVPCGRAPYRSYLCAFPAELLVKIYGIFGPRLLEKNVRTFLELRGKINKGIRETILQEPEMFLAFNNGICIVAEEAAVKVDAEGRTLLYETRDFQIVNGAQTVASLYSAHSKDRVDLSEIHVVGKITAVASADLMDDVVPKISRYANSQNKISIADFSSNHPFHRKLEELSRTVWAPAVKGAQRQTRWYYERARGQYLNDKGRERTVARKKVYEAMHPSRQRFTKTDLAKFENTWAQLPHLVSRGAQKNFQEFMVRLTESGPYLPDEEYFHRLVAKAIMFRQAEALVQSQKFGGYRANIVTYTLALIVRLSEMRIDLERIWREQCLTEAFEQTVISVSARVFAHLTSPPGGANVTEWCKKAACWEALCGADLTLSSTVVSELVPLKPGSSKSVVLNTDLVTETDLANIEAVMAIPANAWLALSLWAKQTRNLQPWQRSLVYNIGKRYVGKQQPPSKKQASQALRALDEAKRLGFDPNNPPEPEFD